MTLHKIVHSEELVTHDFGSLFDQLTRVNSEHAPQGHKIQLVRRHFDHGSYYSEYHKIIVSCPATEAEVDVYENGIEHYDVSLVHISSISVGDSIIFDGEKRVVKDEDLIVYNGYPMLFLDSYDEGRKPVEKLVKRYRSLDAYISNQFINVDD